MRTLEDKEAAKPPYVSTMGSCSPRIHPEDHTHPRNLPTQSGTTSDWYGPAQHLKLTLHFKAT